MTDYSIDDVIFLPFTTRAFATGVPTVFTGTPTVEVWENAAAQVIVEGASKLVLTIDLNSLVGLNMATVTLSAANGFEAGKHYSLIIKTGTVDSINVFGEVVGTFTIAWAAAAVDLANGTDGLTVLKAETALIVADTDELQAEWADAGRLDAILDARMAEASINTTGGAVDTVTTATTATNLTNAPTNGDLTAAMKSSVNTEVDTALNVTTYAEPAQGAFPATDTIVGKISMLAKTLRNKKTSTATLIEIFNDDTTTVDHKRTISDDGTTYTEEEIVTGP